MTSQSRRTRRLIGLLAGVSLASWTMLVAREQQQRADPLAEPFKGITTNVTVVPGLFPIRANGVS